MSAGGPILEVRAVSLGLLGERGSVPRRLLDGVSLQVDAGEVVGVSGESGAGKSLLASAILGLLPPGVEVLDGSIRFGGEPLEGLGAAPRHRLRGAGMSLMVQDALSSLDPLRRIGAQFRQTLRLVAGCGEAAARCEAAAWLDRVGLPAALLRRFPHELSGGQAQRLVLALAMCAQPSLLVADEPSSALDPGNVARIVALLRGVAQDGDRAVLLISHDAAVLRAADRVVRLRAGRIDPVARLPVRDDRPRPAGRSPPGPPVLRLHRIRHWYGVGTRAVPVLDDISLTLREGETLALLGESGCGKSTLARIAAGLLRARDGTLWRAPVAAGRPAAMLFQDPRDSLDPGWSVGRSIAEPLALAAAGGAEAMRRRVAELLWLVGLPPEFAPRRPDGLSGGELQRVAIARALAGRPALLVADEPTSALDLVARAAVIGLLRGLQRKLGFAMLFVTHDRDAAAMVADRIAALRLGHLVAAGADTAEPPGGSLVAPAGGHP